jgi:hypothetical protein
MVTYLQGCDCGHHRPPHTACSQFSVFPNFYTYCTMNRLGGVACAQAAAPWAPCGGRRVAQPAHFIAPRGSDGWMVCPQHTARLPARNLPTSYIHCTVSRRGGTGCGLAMRSVWGAVCTQLARTLDPTRERGQVDGLLPTRSAPVRQPFTHLLQTSEYQLP